MPRQISFSLTTAQFVAMFATHNKCQPYTVVTVLTFKHIS